MVELEVLGIHDNQNYPVVLLRNGDRILPIVVGPWEANAIQLGLMGEKIGRPMTHDLISNLLAGLRGDLQSVIIYKLENDTFFAHLNIEQRSVSGQTEQILRVDTRPSDGIAIAVRMKCPVYAAEEVMDLAAQDISVISSSDDDDEETPEPDFEP